MFECYTEKARRTIFFARYEASNTGSPVIGTEHLLLGLLRENHNLLGDAMAAAKFVEQFRLEITSDQAERVSTSVDLPLSHEAKRVLHYGADEARKMGHLHIGTEHLFLGLLREGGSLAERLSREHGIEIEAIRERISNSEGIFQTNRPDDSPVGRNRLHVLIDMLPDDALTVARNLLERMQTRRDTPANIEDLQGQEGLGEFLRDSTSRMEDGAQIRETHWVVQERDIILLERLKISEDARKLKYSQELHGPKGDHRFEFDIDLA